MLPSQPNGFETINVGTWKELVLFDRIHNTEYTSDKNYVGSIRTNESIGEMLSLDCKKGEHVLLTM